MALQLGCSRAVVASLGTASTRHASLTALLRDALGRRRLLLVLDGATSFNHQLDGAWSTRLRR